MSINSKLLRNVVLPFGDRIFGQMMMNRLKFLEYAQWWPREKIDVHQIEDLRQLVQVAYSEVPFYHSLMDMRGLKPKDITQVEDLVKIPIVTKDMLRGCFPGLCTRPTGQRVYLASTSGSTGKNFFVMEDAFTSGWYRASFMLSLEWAGWQIGEPHLQTGMTLNRSLDRRLKDHLLGCHYFSAFNLDDAHLDEILEEIDRFKLKHLWGYPGSLFYLARRADEVGWNLSLDSVVSWGDSMYPHYRKTITEAFQTKVFDTYGCAEGVQIAAQCEYGNYHLHVLDAVVEFLDEEGQPVRAGEVGNIVVTRLHPGPMPLIRYAIGDMGIPSDVKSCPCGRGFPVMHSIQGRNADVVTTPSGNRLIVHFFTGIMEHFPEVDSFQVVQTKPDGILVRIVPANGKIPGLADKVVNALKEKGAQDLAIQVEFVDQIPILATGKHRFVINNLNK